MLNQELIGVPEMLIQEVKKLSEIACVSVAGVRGGEVMNETIVDLIPVKTDSPINFKVLKCLDLSHRTTPLLLFQFKQKERIAHSSREIIR